MPASSDVSNENSEFGAADCFSKRNLQDRAWEQLLSSNHPFKKEYHALFLAILGNNSNAVHQSDYYFLWKVLEHNPDACDVDPVVLFSDPSDQVVFAAFLADLTAGIGSKQLLDYAVLLKPFSHLKSNKLAFLFVLATLAGGACLAVSGINPFSWGDWLRTVVWSVGAVGGVGSLTMSAAIFSSTQKKHNLCRDMIDKTEKLIKPSQSPDLGGSFDYYNPQDPTGQDGKSPIKRLHSHPF